MDAPKLAAAMEVSRGFAVGALKLLDREGALKFTKEGKNKIYSLDEEAGLISLLCKAYAQATKEHLGRIKFGKPKEGSGISPVGGFIYGSAVVSAAFSDGGKAIYERVVRIPAFRKMLFIIAYANGAGLVDATTRFIHDISALYTGGHFNEKKFTKEELQALMLLSLNIHLSNLGTHVARNEIRGYLKRSSTMKMAASLYSDVETDLEDIVSNDE
jgi:hypothetical protein